MRGGSEMSVRGGGDCHVFVAVWLSISGRVRERVGSVARSFLWRE